MRSSVIKHQATRYIAVGLFVVVVDYLTFVLLLFFFPSAYLIANALGKVAGAGTGFMLHKHYSFAGQQDKSTPTQLGLYVALFLGNIALSSSLIYVGVVVLGCHKLLAKLFTDAVVIALSFFINRLFVFNHCPSLSGDEN